MAAKRRIAVRFSAAAKRRRCCFMWPAGLRITLRSNRLLAVQTYFWFCKCLFQFRCSVLEQLFYTRLTHITLISRQTVLYTVHIQPPAATVNTDVQKPLQLLSTVLNAHCIVHKHSFLRRVNIISVKLFLGHPVFIIECDGCYSRI